MKYHAPPYKLQMAINRKNLIQASKFGLISYRGRPSFHINPSSGLDKLVHIQDKLQRVHVKRSSGTASPIILIRLPFAFVHL